MLVRWAGRDVSDDTWDSRPLERLTNCEAALIAFGQATSRALPCPAPPPPAATAPPPPTGFTVDAASPGDLGAALVGRQMLYWWPDVGWQCCTVARRPSLCPRGAFLQVVTYTRQTSALRCTADSLLQVVFASYRALWVLLSPAPAAGVVAAGSWAGPADVCKPKLPNP